jgi:hypothetical protein
MEYDRRQEEICLDMSKDENEDIESAGGFVPPLGKLFS